MRRPGRPTLATPRAVTSQSNNSSGRNSSKVSTCDFQPTVPFTSCTLSLHLDAVWSQTQVYTDCSCGSLHTVWVWLISRYGPRPGPDTSPILHLHTVVVSSIVQYLSSHSAVFCNINTTGSRPLSQFRELWLLMAQNTDTEDLILSLLTYLHK